MCVRVSLTVASFTLLLCLEAMEGILGCYGWHTVGTSAEKTDLCRDHRDSRLTKSVRATAADG